MPLSYEPDDIERELEGALREIHEIGGATLSTPEWTEQVKLKIGALFDHKPFHVYSTAHPQGEWLYDLTVLHQDNGYHVRCVLALESEWGTPGQVSDDFQKLILCRADHRAIVFEPYHPEKLEHQVHELISEVERCQSRVCGDRYFFAAWVREVGFHFFTHVVEDEA